MNSTYLLKYTGLSDYIYAQSLILKDFVDNQIKRIILNIDDSLN
jgi:hypothetical protein